MKTSLLLPLSVVAFTYHFLTVHSAVPLSSNNKIFGHAIKNGPLPPQTELVTFEHNCTVTPCTVTQLHFPSIYPGGNCPWNWQNGRFRAYIDYETTPSIDISLLEVALVGRNASVSDNSPTDGSPFGNELFGKTALSGGVYTTMRIPFQSNIRTTIESAPDCTCPSIFWFIIRGIEGMPIQLGDEIILPDQAQLHVYRNKNVTLQIEDFITIASTDINTAGALVSVMFDAVSSDFNFLEACVRFFPNELTNPIHLSSGTEDYFLSASYFDEGMFKTSQSGVTYKTGPGQVSMFKVHDSRDYILWQQGMNLTWRNEEDSCPTTWPWPGPQVSSTKSVANDKSKRIGQAPATVDTLVFMYTWPSDSSLLTFNGVPATTIATAAATDGKQKPDTESFENYFRLIRSLVESQLLTDKEETLLLNYLLTKTGTTMDKLLALFRVYGGGDSSKSGQLATVLRSFVLSM